MTLVERNGNVEIWAVQESWGTDYWVYGVLASGPRVSPSLGMARSVAAGGAQ